MALSGKLYLCATPIGNLGDMSQRAIEVLKEVDLVAAEDTRHTMKLFNYFDIHTPLTSYHQHNSRSKGEYLLGALLEGKNVALVSDAGMPGISDPGEELANLAAGAGIIVVPVPGANAALCALVVSGLPAGRFCFEGFLAPRGAERSRRLEQLKNEDRTMIFYESPHRVARTLSDMLKVWGNRKVAIAREITKRYEEIWRGELTEVGGFFAQKSPRGEFTLVVQGVLFGSEGPLISPLPEDPQGVVDLVRERQAKGVDKKEAMREVAKLLGTSRRQVYDMLLKVEKEEEEK